MIKRFQRVFSWHAEASASDFQAKSILISNEMPDEGTDESAMQPTYRMTASFSVLSSLTSGQGIHDDGQKIFTRG